MRLARNLIVGVAIVILAVLSIEGYLDVRRAYAVYESDMRADGRLFGRALSQAIGLARQGRMESLAVVDQDERVEVRVVSLDGSSEHGAPVAPPQVIREGLAKRGALNYRAKDARLYSYVTVEHEPSLALEISEELGPLAAHGRNLAL